MFRARRRPSTSPGAALGHRSIEVEGGTGGHVDRGVDDTASTDGGAGLEPTEENGATASITSMAGLEALLQQEGQVGEEEIEGN